MTNSSAKETREETPDLTVRARAKAEPRWLVLGAAGGAALLAWASLRGFVAGVFLYPGLLAWSLAQLPRRWRPLGAGLWGLVFAGLFYRWVLLYGVIPWAALCLVRGLPWALFPLPGLLLERWGHKGVGPLAVGGGLALTAGALLWGATGVDWETPAGALVGTPVLLGLLPWLGLVGYAGLLGWLSGALFWAPRRLRLLIFASVLALLGWSLSLGQPSGSIDRAPSSSASPTSDGGSVGPLTIALVQPGWAQSDKWDEAQREASVERLFDLTEQAAKDGARLVVWPETSWPYFDLRRSPRHSRRVGRLARSLGVWILAGSIERVPHAEEGDELASGGERPLPARWRNAMSLVSPEGRFEAHYEKRRLAPFAEYLPLSPGWEGKARSLPLLSRISAYEAGVEEPIFAVDDHRVAVMICYESMVPGPAQALADSAHILVVPTNDAPFAHTEANEAHFRSAVLRAAQSRRPVLQAANTGVTGGIDAQGRVHTRTAPGFEGPAVELLTVDPPALP